MHAACSITLDQVMAQGFIVVSLPQSADDRTATTLDAADDWRLTVNPD
jgi:hypothetical protein